MRITETSVYRNGLFDLQNNQEKLTDLQKQMSSGQQINKSSDDPAGTIDVLRLKQIISDSTAQKANVSDGISWLNMADSSLSQLFDVIHRAKDLMVQTSNGIYNADDQKSVSAEVEQLMNTSLDVSNTQINGHFIFSGTKTSTQPFAISVDNTTTPPSYTNTYHGSSGKVIREISSGSTESINVTIDQSLVGSSGLFNVLQQFKTALDTSNTSGVQSLIPQLDKIATAIQTAQSDIGAKTNRMSGAQDNLTQAIDNFTQLLSNKQDVDIAQTYTQLNVAQTTYTATLQTVSKIEQKSLLDYLR